MYDDTFGVAIGHAVADAIFYAYTDALAELDPIALAIAAVQSESASDAYADCVAAYTD
jgi:hypothetical protein